ncbi:MAG: dihydrofolate reductase [Armatimonadetes bacterium]|nr:dihydrofolate reductase [Armatimonadota bacterium]
MGSSEVVLYIASSLDGYIAGPDEDLSWLPWDDEVDFESFTSTVGTVVMGRKTYDFSRSQGEWPMPDTDTYVFTRQPGYEITTPRTWVADRPPVDWVADIRAKSDEVIWLMGGGSLAQEFLEHDLVDRIELGTVPILLGGGSQLFAPLSEYKRFRLTKSNALKKTGIILATYQREPR